MTARRRGSVAPRVLAALVAFVAAGAVGASGTARAAETLRIMPLGDSITRGWDGDVPLANQVWAGYRDPLEDRLVARGQTPDYVGEFTESTPASLADRQHEAVNGQTTGQISARAAAQVPAFSPQVVLVIAGTNDLLQGATPAQAADGMRALLQTLRSAAPTATILVGTLPPMNGPHESADPSEVQAYNALLPGVVGSIGEPIDLVGTGAAVGTSGLGSDGLHPDAGGYASMADAWAAAIPTTPTPPPPPPPQPASAGFTSLSPARLFDSRAGAATVDGLRAGEGPRQAGVVTRVRVAGRGGVPVGAVAAVLNVTATRVGAPGFATLWPCDVAPPNASTLNFAGQDIANGVIAKLDPSGDVCVVTSASTQLIIDVNGAMT